jgi:hypothetical protein
MKIEIDNLPFYIGQEVVAVRDHTNGYSYKNGNEFIVRGVQLKQCRCPGYDVDIGQRIPWAGGIMTCTGCNNSRQTANEPWWHNATDFAPKQVVEESVEVERLEEIEKLG